MINLNFDANEQYACYNCDTSFEVIIHDGIEPVEFCPCCGVELYNDDDDEEFDDDEFDEDEE